jgi:hypothetical protein
MKSPRLAACRKLALSLWMIPQTVYATDAPYDALQKFTSLSSKIINSKECLITGLADFDNYYEHIPVFREAWLNKDHSEDFYRQRRKQIFIFIVAKRYAELLTEGLYRADATRDCSFAINISYSDILGRQKTLTAVTWRFTKDRAKEVVWDKVDPRNFHQVAIEYKIGPEAYWKLFDQTGRKL